jgi:antitoxin (DNA-binding transcriptional repressor) of toxin-antitoxin stability system
LALALTILRGLTWPKQAKSTQEGYKKRTPPLDRAILAIYDGRMDISVTHFKARCLDLIRKVEKSGKSVTIKRRGKIVARLEPASSEGAEKRPWEQLRALGGSVHATPEESVLDDSAFEAQH